MEELKLFRSINTRKKYLPRLRASLIQRIKKKEKVDSIKNREHNLLKTIRLKSIRNKRNDYWKEVINIIITTKYIGR